jgi:hypothetical protein
MVEWIQSNWANIIQVYLATVGLASVIVKLTPTQSDDAVLGKITGFISKWIALNPSAK